MFNVQNSAFWPYWRNAVSINVWKFWSSLITFLDVGAYAKAQGTKDRKQNAALWLWFPKNLSFYSRHPKGKMFTSSNEMISIEKHQALCLGWEYRENNSRKDSEQKPSLPPTLGAFTSAVLGHSIQATVLISGRKSINPTILSIQIRNELPIWPTKEIKWDNE